MNNDIIQFLKGRGSNWNDKRLKRHLNGNLCWHTVLNGNFDNLRDNCVRTKARTKQKRFAKKVINGRLPYISSQSHHRPVQRGCFLNSSWNLMSTLMAGMLKVNWDFERGITWCPPFLLRPPSLPRPLLPSGNPPFTLMEQMKVIEVPLCRSQLWHKRNPHKNCLHFEIHFRHLRW